jgi:hypothetical protein
MYYTNEEEVINDMTYNILNTNKHNNIQFIEDIVKKTVKEELYKMGGLKSLNCLMYTKKDLYTNINNKLYWVFEIYR